MKEPVGRLNVPQPAPRTGGHSRVEDRWPQSRTRRSPKRHRRFSAPSGERGAAVAPVSGRELRRAKPPVAPPRLYATFKEQNPCSPFLLREPPRPHRNTKGRHQGGPSAGSDQDGKLFKGSHTIKPSRVRRSLNERPMDGAGSNVHCNRQLRQSQPPNQKVRRFCAAAAFSLPRRVKKHCLGREPCRGASLRSIPTAEPPRRFFPPVRALHIHCLQLL